MNVVIKEESEHDKHRYLKHIKLIQIETKRCLGQVFNLMSQTPK